MLKFAIPALAALSLAVPAQAHELDSFTVSVAVPYGDLDLTTETGAATLDARIAAAVKQVCGQPASRDLYAWTTWQKCREEAKEGAVQQLAALRANAPLVALAR